MQLDIFDDSREIMLRNDVLDALQRRDSITAQLAWDALCREYAEDETLAPLAVLIDAVAPFDAAAFADHATCRDARIRLTEHVLPAATRLWGEKIGPSWLIPMWRQVAKRAARLAFRAEHGEDHAAPLWLRAGDWASASDAATRVESWRRIPLPLAWMAEARYRIDGLDAVWPLLAELAWLSPGRFDELLRRLADPLLDKLLKAFDAGFEGQGWPSDLAWFPAWVLTETPALSSPLGLAQASLQQAPERAMRLVLELLGLERQGRHHELITRRKELRDLNPALYAAYMRTR